jgi:hypothetical protein
MSNIILDVCCEVNSRAKFERASRVHFLHKLVVDDCGIQRRAFAQLKVNPMVRRHAYRKQNEGNKRQKPAACWHNTHRKPLFRKVTASSGL